jgi:methylglutaconyl-CoA hydratase
MDLKEALEARDDRTAGIHERLFTVLDWTQKPIVAAVHGAAAGGGTGLAANAHIVVAAPDARFGLTEIKIALWPVLIFPAVALAMGERKATELSLTGRFFDAHEAQQFGLVSEVVENPLARAKSLAKEIAEFSANALAKGLAYSRRIRNMSRQESGQAGRETRAQLMAHPDFARAVKAFFAGKPTAP